MGSAWNPNSPVPPRRQQATPMTPPSRPRVQSVSEHYPTTAPLSFPEPQFHRATSYRESHRENLSVPSHRLTHHNRSDNSNLLLPLTSPSLASIASSYSEDDHYGLGSTDVRSSIPSLSFISLFHL